MHPKDDSPEGKPRRKGAARRADIPPDVLQALNEGREETITLVELLAIDMPTLLGAILPGVGLADARDELVDKARSMADEGVTRRLKGIGKALFAATQTHPKRTDIFEALASHTSDTVRAWAVYILAADKGIPLDKRLDRTVVDTSVQGRSNLVSRSSSWANSLGRTSIATSRSSTGTLNLALYHLCRSGGRSHTCRDVLLRRATSRDFNGTSGN